MADPIRLELPDNELNILARDLEELFDHDRAFFGTAPAVDESRVLGYLRLQQARVKAGLAKGFDLRLPPWASLVVLAHMFPAKAKPAKAAKAAKPARKAHAPRKKRPSELRKERERRDADRPLPGMALADELGDAFEDGQ